MDKELITIVLGLDLCDQYTHLALMEWNDSESYRVKFVWMGRPDTMGEKYNRLARAAEADIYLAWADDVEMTTSGWDERLRQAAQGFRVPGPRNEWEPGIILGGPAPDGFLPTLYALNRPMFGALGYFAPEWFPNWWCETWITEIAHLTQRYSFLSETGEEILYNEMQAESTTGRGRTQGLRDVRFWTEFFAATRSLRKADAERVLRMWEPRSWTRNRVMSWWSALDPWFDHHQSNLRQNADYLEQVFCIDSTVEDPRFARAKERAEAWLKNSR